LFDEPENAVNVELGDVDVVRELNKQLTANPDTPMPNGYVKKL
jgi:hypothetical protein